MRFLKAFLFLILWVGSPSVSFADDLWGSDSELGSSNAENDLWGTPEPKAVKKAPLAKPAAKVEAKPAAKPVAEPVAQPAAQPAALPVAQPIVEPVAEPVPDPIIRRGDPVPQARDTVVTETVPAVTVPPQEDSVATVAAEVDSTSTELSAELLSESTELVVDSSSKTDSAATPVAAAVDSVVKDTVAAKPDSAATATVDGFAMYDSLHTDKKESLRFGGMGLLVNGSYGLFNQKLKSNSFMVPSAGAGITAMIGYSHFALRLEGLFIYERIYVSEEAGTVNEGLWRVGGGAFARFMSGLKYGFVAEVGASVYSSLMNDIVLYDDQKTVWTLKPLTEIPLEVAVGYKIPVKPVSFEVDAIFNYELSNSMNFAFGGDYKATAWHAGIRAIAWLF
ncbi:MAG: hypothetical protein IK114_04845 [Fibrobacter sp.]|nr:hypothetical protein [Fibrobacter sp.]